MARLVNQTGQALTFLQGDEAVFELEAEQLEQAGAGGVAAAAAEVEEEEGEEEAEPGLEFNFQGNVAYAGVVRLGGENGPQYQFGGGGFFVNNRTYTFDPPANNGHLHMGVAGQGGQIHQGVNYQLAQEQD